jgi:hypothetical protein
MNISQTLIVSGLVTIVGSGFGTAIVNYWLGQRRAKREFMRSKLEELHQTVRSYGDIHRAAFVKYSAALRGEISFQIAIDDYEKVGGQRGDTAIRSRIELLISFYFNALTPGMKKFNDARRKMMQIFREAEDARTKGQDTSAYAPPFWEAIEVLASEEGSLCTNIARLAKQFV